MDTFEQKVRNFFFCEIKAFKVWQIKEAFGFEKYKDDPQHQMEKLILDIKFETDQ